MMSYASWTRTRSTLRLMRQHGWRILATPRTLQGSRNKQAPYWADGSPAPYALDNGAWGCHTRGEPFDADHFRWALDKLGENADWVVIPDKVGDREATLESAEQWWPRLEGLRLLLPVQDGMGEDDVEPWLDRGVGLFVGGTTDWKMGSIRRWTTLARQHNAHCHVARINGAARIKTCSHFGVDSIDGKSIVLFPSTFHLLNTALRQRPLFGGTQ